MWREADSLFKTAANGPILSGSQPHARPGHLPEYGRKKGLEPSLLEPTSASVLFVHQNQ